MGYTKNNNVTYDENYYRNLLAADPVYAESGETQAAAQKLASAQNNVPKGTYQGTYAQGITDAVNQYLAKNTFNYNPSQDAYYQQYKDVYTQGAQKAQADSTAQAKVLSGGFNNSYADIVGSEVGNEFAASVSDNYGNYKDFAYDRYQGDKNNLLQQINLLEQLDSAEYQKDRDTMSDYFSFLNYYNSKYDTQRNLDLANFQNEWEAYNTKLTAAQSDYQYENTANINNYQFDKNYSEQDRQNSMSNAYNNAALAENQRQFDETMDYTALYDQAAAAEKARQKGNYAGNTNNANAIIAGLRPKKEFEGSTLFYDDYIQDTVNDLAKKGQITPEEEAYIYLQTGLIKDEDDTSFDTQKSDAMLLNYNLIDESGTPVMLLGFKTEEDGSKTPVTKTLDELTEKELTENANRSQSIILKLLDSGEITREQASYMLVKSGAKLNTNNTNNKIGSSIFSNHLDSTVFRPR